jgi:signal peptidase I
MSLMSRLKLTRWRLAGVAFIAAMIACLPAYLSAYTVSGTSDAPTLLLGDRVLVNRAAYDLRAPYSNIRLARVGTPQRGDLVVVLTPKRRPLGLKRVVGVPGDRVEMLENRLYVNGHQVPQKFLKRDDFNGVSSAHGLGTVVAAERSGGEYRVTYTPGRSPLRTFEPVTVPTDCVFLLGDNRDNSKDSRTIGPIGRDLIAGKVVRIMPARRPSRPAVRPELRSLRRV